MELQSFSVGQTFSKKNKQKSVNVYQAAVV
uniref:Uncharacterized protein n=1 Tax=Solanum lycopersicum TaxID=4081 RepID=A0A3Q7GHH3_SOLLC